MLYVKSGFFLTHVVFNLTIEWTPRVRGGDIDVASTPTQDCCKNSWHYPCKVPWHIRSPILAPPSMRGPDAYSKTTSPSRTENSLHEWHLSVLCSLCQLQAQLIENKGVSNLHILIVYNTNSSSSLTDNTHFFPPFLEVVLLNMEHCNVLAIKPNLALATIIFFTLIHCLIAPINWEEVQ